MVLSSALEPYWWETGKWRIWIKSFHQLKTETPGKVVDGSPLTPKFPPCWRIRSISSGDALIYWPVFSWLKARNLPPADAEVPFRCAAQGLNAADNDSFRYWLFCRWVYQLTPSRLLKKRWHFQSQQGLVHWSIRTGCSVLTSDWSLSVPKNPISVFVCSFCCLSAVMLLCTFLLLAPWK